LHHEVLRSIAAKENSNVTFRSGIGAAVAASVAASATWLASVDAHAQSADSTATLWTSAKASEGGT
jgi:hypothetical protein